MAWLIILTNSYIAGFAIIAYGSCSLCCSTACIIATKDLITYETIKFSVLPRCSSSELDLLHEMTDTNTINVINAMCDWNSEILTLRSQMRTIQWQDTSSLWSGSSCLKYYFLNSQTHITMLWTIVMNAYNFCTITIKTP